MEVLTSTPHLIKCKENEESDQYLVTNICLLKWHQFVQIILEKELQGVVPLGASAVALL